LIATEKRRRTRSPGRRARGVTVPSETSPSGDCSRAVTAGCWTPSLRFSSQPSTSTFHSHFDATQTRRGSRPASCMTIGPRATSETWRVMPPQFHQPSRSRESRR
jgi:hypothetical protein